MMIQLLRKNPLILMEASIVEQLRRSGEVRLHETLVNAPLIYEQTSSRMMDTLYNGYIDVALRAHLPVLVCTPTWRANQERVSESSISNTINQDAALHMKRVRDSREPGGSTIKIGGMIGCRNDCYLPAEGLSASDSQNFHAWQLEQLVEGGVDFLVAQTLPNVQEALGIARAMESTGTPYIISFVISRDGKVLDGSALDAAMDLIDSSTTQRPLGYMVNCAHPSFLCAERQPAGMFSRLIGYQANASSLDHCDLDHAGELKVDSVSEWGQLMLTLNQRYGVQILGGCCGTGIEHLQYLVKNREP